MVATFKCTHLGAGTGVDPGWIPTVRKLPVGEGGDGAVEEHGLGTMLRRESPLDLVINWVWKAQARNASKMTPRWPVAFLEILKAALCNHPHSLAGLASKLPPSQLCDLVEMDCLRHSLLSATNSGCLS